MMVVLQYHQRGVQPPDSFPLQTMGVVWDMELARPVNRQTFFVREHDAGVTIQSDLEGILNL